MEDEREERRWPAWADHDEWEGFDVDGGRRHGRDRRERPASMNKRTGPCCSRIDHRASDVAPPAQTETANSRQSAVSAYFLEMDTIQSDSGAGDPNTFAMGMIKAGLGRLDGRVRPTDRRYVADGGADSGAHAAAISVRSTTRLRSERWSRAALSWER